MTATAFDTLKAVRDLEAAGIESKQAEAIVSTIRQSGEAVATKVDLDAMRNAVKADLAELKSDMLKVAIGVVVANVGLTVTLIKLL